VVAAVEPAGPPPITMTSHGEEEVAAFMRSKEGSGLAGHRKIKCGRAFPPVRAGIR
jgi:hypothetical protein